VAIFALFVWAFWRYLCILSPNRALLAFLAILGFVSLTTSLYLSSFIDHSFFFIIFTSIPILQMLIRDTSNPERWVGLLVVGVFFRITVAIVLVCYLFFVYRKIRDSRWILLAPSITVPYLMVFCLTFNPAIFNPAAEADTSPNYLIAVRDFLTASSLNMSWVNIFVFLVMLGFVFLTNIGTSWKIALYLALSFLTYFIVLNPAIEGSPKYQLEWLSTLMLVLNGYLVTRIRHSYLLKSFLLLVSLLITTNIWQGFFTQYQYEVRVKSVQAVPLSLKQSSNSVIFLDHPLHNYEKILHRVPKAERGRCLIMGTTYGQILEIMAGRSREEILRVRELKGAFVQAKNEEVIMRSSADFDIASLVGVKCLISPLRLDGNTNRVSSQWFLYYSDKDSRSADHLKIYLSR
jgi:hypothetical protein